jgi:hypothetical protein
MGTSRRSPGAAFEGVPTPAVRFALALKGTRKDARWDGARANGLAKARHGMRADGSLAARFDPSVEILLGRHLRLEAMVSIVRRVRDDG